MINKLETLGSPRFWQHLKKSTSKMKRGFASSYLNLVPQDISSVIEEFNICSYFGKKRSFRKFLEQV